MHIYNRNGESSSSVWLKFAQSINLGVQWIFFFFVREIVKLKLTDTPHREFFLFCYFDNNSTQKSNFLWNA